MGNDALINYLGTQAKSIGDDLSALLKNGNPARIEVELERCRKRIDFLRGYATCMEHAGVLSRKDAEMVFNAFDVGTPKPAAATSC